MDFLGNSFLPVSLRCDLIYSMFIGQHDLCWCCVRNNLLYVIPISWHDFFPISVLFCATVPETFAPTLLRKRAKRMRTETGRADIVTEQELFKASFSQVLVETLVRPFGTSRCYHPLPSFLITGRFRNGCYRAYLTIDVVIYCSHLWSFGTSSLYIHKTNSWSISP